MADSASAILTPWATFYTVAGSAAAGLTGLMFVVITLVTDARRGSTHDGIDTFSTPTVMHFSAALLVSLILCVPWHALSYPAALLAAFGVWGIGYTAIVGIRARKLTAYQPDASDWTWYTLLPFIAYVAMLAGALAFFVLVVTAPYAIAFAVALLLFIGIRNAWDVVTFLAIDSSDNESAPKPPGKDV